MSHHMSETICDYCIIFTHNTKGVSYAHGAAVYYGLFLNWNTIAQAPEVIIPHSVCFPPKSGPCNSMVSVGFSVSHLFFVYYLVNIFK